MKILIIEDDHLQSKLLIKQLNHEFKDCTIELLETESDFIKKFPMIEKNPPDLILIDIMLRFQNPSRDMIKVIPSDRKGFYRAGIRCKQDLNQSEQTKSIPIILYTVLNKADLEIDLLNLNNQFQHISKDKDTSILFRQIKKMLKLKS
ncbi:MAG TPA: hypothetical protein PL089_13870 [Ignavibacteria bacterium]|nr:hypothetical protein [Ignavibacteriaceae bacterium]HRK00693.1 hypothetical protein [Ignavibacteria bacterium]